MNKSTPITQKCKSSPMKMSEALVNGEAQTQSSFVDVGSIVKDAFDKKGTDANADQKKAVIPPKDSKEEAKNFFTDKLKNFNMDDYKIGSTK
jgi:hypothetical protein